MSKLPGESPYFFVVWTLKIYLLNKFQLFNKMLSTVKKNKNKNKNHPASWGLHLLFLLCIWGFSGGSSGEEPTCQCRRHTRCGFDPCLGRSPAEGHDNPLQYSCLENPMDRGAWRATIHRVAESDLMEATQHARMHFASRCRTWEDANGKLFF